MRRTRAEGREARDGIGEGGGGTQKRSKPQKMMYCCTDAMWKTGENMTINRAKGEKKI